MSEYTKMKQEERKLFLEYMEAAQAASTALERMHSACEELMGKYGWDIDIWAIAKAAMTVECETRGNWRMFLQTADCKKEGGAI